MNKNISETNNFIQLANKLGASTTGEDEAIAFCLNCPNPDIWAPAFERLKEKYEEFVNGLINEHCPKMSATAKDTIFCMTFDRLSRYRSKAIVRAEKGSLGGLVCLVCMWSITTTSRREGRRHELLTKYYQDLWLVRRDEANVFQGDAITDQDVEELLNIIQQALNPAVYPGASRVMEAISAIFLNSNGMQLQNFPANPSIAGIKNYLDGHGHRMTEGEIEHYLTILRSKVKAVLEEQGWELTPTSKNAP